MYHVSTQGVDEHMINVHYYYYYFPLTFCERSASFIFCEIFLIHTVCGFFCFVFVFFLHLNFDIFFQVIQEPVDMWRNIKGHNALVSSSSNYHHLSLFTPSFLNPFPALVLYDIPSFKRCHRISCSNSDC